MAVSNDRPRTLPAMLADFKALSEQATRYIEDRDVLRAEQAMADARGVTEEIRAHYADCSSAAAKIQ